MTILNYLNFLREKAVTQFKNTTVTTVHKNKCNNCKKKKNVIHEDDIIEDDIIEDDEINIDDN